MSKKNNNNGSNNSVDSTRLILLILTVFTWFIGALLYLFIVKPKGVELVVCVLACFIPFFPGIVLLLNAFKIINLN